jgi:L-seryl-tRNA(Ser) seleniumtransferase
MASTEDPRRFVPSVDRLLRTPPLEAALADSPRWSVLEAARTVLDEARAGLIPVPSNGDRDAFIAGLAARAVERIGRLTKYKLERVINATGVVLHTNLGRAPLSERAIAHIAEIAGTYSNLELDLSTGERGTRYALVEGLIAELAGSEAAIVVNNNAAAVILALSEIARGKEVIISRGQLIEIGGSFRIPAIMAESGAKLVEVGTTNRTRIADYERAITPNTAMLLEVHTSNYRIVGFTEKAPAPDLAALASARGLVFMNDLGSGCLVDLAAFGLPHEPTVREAIAEGAHLVTFSGDKLLGGPQIGVIAGRKDIVRRLSKHPLLRAFRVDKLTLAALEATLRIYRDEPDPTTKIPTLRMLGATAVEIGRRAERFAGLLGPKLAGLAEVTVIDGKSQAGGGSLPDAVIPTRLVAIAPSRARPDQVEVELRRRTPPVMVRVADGRLLVDLRSVFDAEEELLRASIEGAFEGLPKA